MSARSGNRCRRAHQEGDVDGVVDVDLGALAPDVSEEVLKNEARLVPHELVVPLRESGRGDLAGALPVLALASDDVAAEEGEDLVLFYRFRKARTMCRISCNEDQ